MSEAPTRLPLEIAATFTAEPLARFLDHWSSVLGIPVETNFAPYNQVFQTLLSPTSPFQKNTSGLKILLIRPEDWQRFGETGSSEWKEELRKNTEEFCRCLRSQTNNSASQYFIILAESSPSTSGSTELSGFTKELRETIAKTCHELALPCLLSSKLLENHKNAEHHDPITDREGHVPFTEHYYAALATAIMRRVHAHVIPSPKVIVLDADNTLWPGVAAEKKNLVITEPFQALQRFLKQCADTGILLCVASKNEEHDVRAVFTENEGMVLREKDIVAWKVNWDRKSDNIAALASELSLGLDSFVFFDDNPVELAEVSSALPEVTTIKIPSDHDEICILLDHLWPLDARSSATTEDRERTAMYQTMATRANAREQADDFQDFLNKLNLEVQFLSPTPEILPRLSQLTQRTNQFNSTCLRREEAELSALLEHGQSVLAVSAKDRFGDYGIIGLASFGKRDQALAVDSFLLSCRVLGRGVEQQFLAHLGKLASEKVLSEITFLFRETDRNTPVRNFLERIGKKSEHAEETVYTISTSDAINASSLEVLELDDKSAKEEKHSGSHQALISSDTYEVVVQLSQPKHLVTQVNKERINRPNLAETFIAPQSKIEKTIAGHWQEILGIEPIGRQDKFSSLGGKSLQVVQLLSRLTREFDQPISSAALFENSTISAQAKLLSGEPTKTESAAPAPQKKDRSNEHPDLAVVGMSCRLPKSPNVHQFWQNLLDGRECLSQLTDEELLSSGVDPSSVRNDSSYLPVKGLMDDVQNFDAAFFGILPKEAKYMDPQQRVFLELAWECIEDAGYNPETYEGRIGLWAGNYLDTYVIANLVTDREFLKNWIPSIQVGSLQAELGNDKDYLATRVAFKLNLRGPAMTVQTACSTSLVAISQAAQALRSGSCDMAMAGGVTITLPEKKGYYYTPDGMLSGDGSCRAFDERASGTVFSNGAGIVLLKRLEDAQRDGDHIHSVIKGYALNNDGGTKHSYTAPSIDGQAGVITDAITDAGVDPSTITYVEAHGTGTPLGDPIEVAALTKAYRELGVTHQQGCTLGTVKTNVGHLDVASGVTALIKTSFALEHGVLPPTLHYKNPNPKIDFANSPFQVRNELHQWNPDGHPRRAGISSFGVGGTNAHVILEEPPEVPSSKSERPFHLFPISARSKEALAKAHENLANFFGAENLSSHPNPADVSHTLRIGRKHFGERQILVTGDLTKLKEAATVKGSPKATDAPLVFMFPGQGSQTVGMGKDLYASEPVFRDHLDRCAEILLPHLGEDLRDTLFPPADADQEAAAHRIKQTIMAQPAIFVLSYCQAKLLMHWGLQPTALVGHSVGELVAATVSGVVSLEDALEILANRGRLMQQVESGGMLSVRLSEKELAPLIPEKLDLAAVNGPNLCVVAGPHDELEKFIAILEEKDIAAKPLHTSHGFHSWMMDGVIEPFQKVIEKAKLSAPQIPIRSTVTTEWLSDAQATDPHYWASHVRKTVRFTEAAAHFCETPETTLLEVGPGQTLSTLSRQVSQKGAKQAIFSCSGHATDTDSDALHFHLALGQLWLHGHSIDWSAYDEGETRKRTPLPTYPFERKRFWIDPKPLENEPAATTAPAVAPAPSLPTLALPATPVAPPPTPEPQPTVTTPVSTDRKPAILDQLRLVLEDLSGIEPEEMEVDASLIELGFDSLMLTQVSKAVEKSFGVTTTMRQLLSELPTIADLLNHLDKEMPADKFAESAPAPAAAAQAPTAAAPTTTMPAMSTMAAPPAIPGDQNSMMAQMMAMQMQQMQFMQQQIAAMAGLSAAAPPAAPASTPQAAQAATPAPSPEPAAKKEDTPSKPSGPSGSSTTITRETDESLSSTQLQHLKGLIDRYTSKTKSSKVWTERYRKHYADPRTVAGFNRNWKEMIYQIVTDRSKGSRLLDIDGNEYIDILNGFGPGFFGHSPDYVVEAVKAQLDKGFEVGPQMMLAGETAELFCELTGNERASFVCTGSEAVQGAMRVARTHTGRDKIAVFNKDYHGNFDEVLLRGTQGKNGPRSFPSAPGIPKQSVGNMLILDYGTEESMEILKAHAHELAAIMVEPVQSRRPEFQPREFVQDLRQLCNDCGALFIMDEVICGLRDGPQGAQGFYGVKADISTYGKVVGGGMPIGIVAGKAEYMNIFDGGMWQFGDDSFPETGVTFFAGTFVRHPLALASANAVLKHLKTQGPALWTGLNARAERLYQTVDQFMVDNQVPVRVPGLHSRFFIRVDPDWKYGNLLFFHLREKGVFALEGFPSYVTTEHTDEDIDYVINAFKESVLELQAGGFLPKTDAHSDLKATRLQGPPPRLTARSGSDTSIQSPFQVVLPSQEIAATPAEPERNTEIPLTEAQREIWLACQLGHEASCAFNEATSLVFDGDFDAEAMIRALNTAVNHHDALRAQFEADGNFWETAHQVTITVPAEDISSKTAEEQETAIQIETETQAFTPFDLQKAPLVRAKLIRLSPTRHILFLTAHHIVADGWSFNVLVENLSDCYNAFLKDHSNPLLPSVSFSNYALERSRKESSERENPHLAYWLEQYPDTVPVLNLPTDRPFPPFRSFSGGTIRREISKDLLKKLRKEGAKHGATLFSTTLAAFQMLLQRLTAQNDFVIGIPAAGQSSQELENMVGHCVNFLPVRSKLTPKQPFGDLVQEVAVKVLEAYEHQDCAYGQLIPHLQLQRHPGRMPLAEVGFNLERMDYFKPFDGLDTDFIDSPKSFVNQLLFLNLVESKGGVSAECHFNTTVFDTTTVDHWISDYLSLLEEICSPTPPQDQETSTPKNLTEPLPLSANNQTDYPRHANIQQVFEGVAATSPDHVALQLRDQTLTYGALNQLSNRLAYQLRDAGVTSNQAIPIVVERSFEYIISILAVLKAGGGYLPVDPEYPAERISNILSSIDTPIVLAQSRFLEKLPDFARKKCLQVDAFFQHASTDEARLSDLKPTNKATDLAYMMFTSGSTGVAKGVGIPHRGVVRLVKNTNYARLDENEVFLLASSLSFDASTFEIWAPLLNGGRLILLPPGPADLANISSNIRNHGVTTLWLTSGLFQLMIDENIDSLESVRQLIAGGDVLSRHHVAKAFRNLPHTTLINGYGPTENTTFTCCHRITEEDLHSPSIPIGKPIANTEVYLLNAQLNPLPPETEGELYLSGDGLALGYYKNQDLTRTRFIQNPFSADPHSKLYKTGDRARYRQDGTIEFLGRVDLELKIRGYRIDPAEIENALCLHPAVQQARVISRGSTAAEKTLLAYVSSSDKETTEAELKKTLANRLPAHLIPSRIVTLDHLPVTPNGKIDDQALPEPTLVDMASQEQERAPHGDLEIRMAKIWQNVLGLDAIPANRSFFDLGGHSLQALKLFHRIDKEFGQKLPLSTLFESSTIAQLAQRFAPRDPTKVTPPTLAALNKEGHRTPFFCIHGGDGGTLIYHSLADGLTKDRPLYTLEAPALSGAGDVLPSIEETAALYLAQIRTVQPKGPYLLGGYCYGGLVCYEMAQQLQAQGEQVGLLCLFDTDNPQVAPRYLSLTERAAKNWRDNSGESWAGKVGKLSGRLSGGLVNKLKYKTEQAAAAITTSTGLEAGDKLLPVIIREANDKVMSEYTPKAYNGDIVLFTAEEQGDGVVYPPHLGWEGYVKGELKLVSIPGEHLTVFQEPHVQEFARKLNEILSRCL